LGMCCHPRPRRGGRAVRNEIRAVLHPPVNRGRARIKRRFVRYAA
jgi:hypothetical protein